MTPPNHPPRRRFKLTFGTDLARAIELSVKIFLACAIKVLSRAAFQAGALALAPYVFVYFTAFHVRIRR